MIGTANSVWFKLRRTSSQIYADGWLTPDQKALYQPVAPVCYAYRLVVDSHRVFELFHGGRGRNERSAATA